MLETSSIHESSSRFDSKLAYDGRTDRHTTTENILYSIAEMDMGWVHPWVGSHFQAHVICWVGLNEKYYYFFHCILYLL